MRTGIGIELWKRGKKLESEERQLKVKEMIKRRRPNKIGEGSEKGFKKLRLDENRARDRILEEGKRA